MNRNFEILTGLVILSLLAILSVCTSISDVGDEIPSDAEFDDQLPNSIHVESTSGCDAPLSPFGFGIWAADRQPIEWLDCP